MSTLLLSLLKWKPSVHRLVLRENAEVKEGGTFSVSREITGNFLSHVSVIGGIG